jgi:hypothetical protein
VIRAIREHEPELRALSVSWLWLFGSLARGDAGRKSDVDLLISVPPAQKFSLLDLAGVRVELCEFLGRDTDVVIREDVQPRLWEAIKDDLVEVFLMARELRAERLRHILDAIARVETLTAREDLTAYLADWMTRDAVERNLERVSEASRHIPAALKARHPSIHWRVIAGLGNVLRHDCPN